MLQHPKLEGARGKRAGELVAKRYLKSGANLRGRLGLHLIDQYARGSPAWAAWRQRFTPFIRSIPSQETQQSWSQNPG